MSADKQTLKRLAALALMNQRLERKLMAVQSVLGRHILWIGQSANSSLSHADIKILLEDLHK